MRHLVRNFLRKTILFRTVMSAVTNVFILVTAYGQTDTKAQAIQRLQDLSVAYRQADHLSFAVSYRYSSELKPTSFLDSLAGNFKMNGNSFWYGIDNAEFLGNDTLNVAIFNDDKVIYVNGRKVVNQSANPLAMIDSVLLNNQYSSATITTGSVIQDLLINFQPGFQFKKVEYFIDVKTGFIRRMIGIIHSQQMYDPEVQSLFDKKQTFGILDIVYSNYQTASFSDQMLSPAKYFSGSNGHYQGTGVYSAYQIITGSSNP